ncbi:magnesium transporter CorA family protein [Luteimicrobium sp. DT211]|uniref:magnesium transporter CorA family protein n=1 Tax=Luteimicrobium sp. DT211 TaxID=3393412 RepID=UPI003CFB9EA5
MTTSAVRTRAWRDGTVVAEDFPFDQISDYVDSGDCLVWADVCAPDDEILAGLAEELRLDPHAVEDARGRNERPKAARYPTHTFVTTDALRRDPGTGEVVMTRVSVFTTKHAVVTVRLDDGFDIGPVLQRWDENAALLRYGPRALVYGLLDVLVDQYFETLQGIDDEVEALEDALFEESPTSGRRLQERTFRARKDLARVRRVVLPMREVVNTVTRRAIEPDDSGELVPYFEDLYDHVLRATDWSDSLRDLIASVHETTMALADNRMNQVMKQLTAWAAIIAVPTAITGFFGQNVPFPGFGRPWGVSLSVGLIVVVAVVLYAQFKRKDWL